MTTMTTISSTLYFVTPAPGYCSDLDRVLSSHRTLRAARRAAGRGYVVREGALRRGDRWTRHMAEIYPVVQRLDGASTSL